MRTSGFFAVALLCSTVASADELQFVVPTFKQIPSDEARWVVCYRWDQANNYVYVSNIRRSTYGDSSGELTWADFIDENYDVSDKLYGGCNTEKSESDAQWRRGVFLERQPSHPKTFVEVEWTGPISRPAKAADKDSAQAKRKVPKSPQAESENAQGPTAAEVAARRHAEVEKRNREKQSRYEADMKAWQDQIDAQKAEEQRKQAKFEADKLAAAKKLADFEAQQEAHRKQMADHAQRLIEYQDKRNFQLLCNAGDRVACDRLVRKSPASAKDSATDRSQASTDDDPRQCVTEPVVSDSKTWKNALQAVVFNGCKQAVDVKICFQMTSGKWNCGVQWGVKPQDKWTWWSFETAGQIFWDARTSRGQGPALRSPE